MFFLYYFTINKQYTTDKIKRRVFNMLKNVKFNLRNGEVIRKVKGFVEADGKQVAHRVVWDYLNVLNYEGLLPKGYLTRASNGNISYQSCVKMCERLFNESKYRIESFRIDDSRHLVALIEKVS